MTMTKFLLFNLKSHTKWPLHSVTGTSNSKKKKDSMITHGILKTVKV